MSSHQAPKAARQNSPAVASAASAKFQPPPNLDVNVLCNESPSQFEKLKNLYYEKFQPKDQVEIDLVEDMAAARWRIGRIRYMKSAALDVEMNRQADDISKDFQSIDEPTRAILAFPNWPTPKPPRPSAPPRKQLRPREANENLRNDPKPAEKAPVRPLSEHREPDPHENLRNDPKPAEEAPVPPLSKHHEPVPHENLRNDPKPAEKAPVRPLSEHREPARTKICETTPIRLIGPRNDWESRL